ncbi:unnamed protein product [Symbiodinium sp. CCMP2456]|nr:unnamed protein product [Symbiodinium sp. CCMP2456]
MADPLTPGLLDSPTSLQPEGVAEQEEQARTLNATLPPSLELDDRSFREPVCHRHTAADSGGMWNYFSSLLGTSQKDLENKLKDLENKLNERIHQKVTLLETSLHGLSVQCSVQSDRINNLETRLQHATEELRAMMESRLTSHQNRSDRELRDVKRSLDSVLVPDEMLTKLGARLKQDLDVEVSRLRSHLAALEAHLAKVVPTWTFSGSAGTEDVGYCGKDLPPQQHGETWRLACCRVPRRQRQWRYGCLVGQRSNIATIVDISAIVLDTISIITGYH